MIQIRESPYGIAPWTNPVRRLIEDIRWAVPLAGLRFSRESQFCRDLHLGGERMLSKMQSTAAFKGKVGDIEVALT